MSLRSFRLRPVRGHRQCRNPFANVLSTLLTLYITKSFRFSHPPTQQHIFFGN